MVYAFAHDDTSADDAIRDAIERSQHGAPSAGAVLRDQFETYEVFQRIVAADDEEATTGPRELFFSGLAAGFAIMVTYLLYASLTVATDGDPVLSALLYPLGFVFIVLGGYQLYTENTLPPVALVLERLMSVPRLFVIWGLVILGNFAGGAAGAAALAWGGVLSDDAAVAATSLALKGLATPFWSLVAKAAFAGLIVAGVVWLVYAVTNSVTRLLVIYLAFLAIPIGNLYHSVVSFTELTYLVLVGEATFLVGMTGFVVPVLLGNTLGGVLLVTVVNYFQTTEERLDIARKDGAARRLTPREWLLGRRGGRSYVPGDGPDGEA